MAPEGGGAASLDRLESPALDGGEAARATKRVAMGAHDVRELQSRTDARDRRARWHGAHRSALWRRREPLEQIKRRAGAHLRVPGQLKVTGRRADVSVAEQPLNGVNVDAGFEQVRRKGVTQRILALLMNRPQRSSTTVTIPFTANL